MNIDMLKKKIKGKCHPIDRMDKSEKLTNRPWNKDITAYVYLIIESSLQTQGPDLPLSSSVD